MKTEVRKEPLMKTEVTVEPNYLCIACGHQGLLWDCQLDLFGTRVGRYWCESCGLEVMIGIVGFGLPRGGFLILPEVRDISPTIQHTDSHQVNT